MPPFIPRPTFPTLPSLPRSYFLGHHRAGLTKMKTMLSSIDLVIECRDYRLPLTSRNPLFEETLAGRKRLVVYTKQDLGSMNTREDEIRESLLITHHAPDPTLFSSPHGPSTPQLLTHLRAHSRTLASLTGSRILIVGMPNVGKSTLLNALRAHSLHLGKAASTGAQPGITRKIGTAVKIIAADAADGDNGGSVYLMDTPGVFVPYVREGESMLKLALCTCVKDTVVQPTTLADYLLFRLNLYNPDVYAAYAAPTNDVMVFLEGVARKTGRLRKGGEADFEGAALWVVQRWRGGALGRFVLDAVGVDVEGMKEVGGSLSQARRAQREWRRLKAKTRKVEA